MSEEEGMRREKWLTSVDYVEKDIDSCIRDG